MSTDTEEILIESQASEELQTKARNMGWIGPDKYKGPPEKFIDADAYVERGEQMLPILKANNKRLQEQVNSSTEAIARLNNETMRLKKFVEDQEEAGAVAVQRAREEERSKLKDQLREASREGDHDAVADLTVKLTDLRDDPPPKKKEDTTTTTVTNAPLDEATKQFSADNPWYGKDGFEDDTALFNGLAIKLRKQGNKATGADFYADVMEAFEEKTGKSKANERPQDKVSGGRNGSGDGGGGTQSRAGGKGYAHLPADAKQACDSEIKNRVGKDKRYKTDAEWRARYASIYFQGDT